MINKPENITTETIKYEEHKDKSWGEKDEWCLYELRDKLKCTNICVIEDHKKKKREKVFKEKVSKYSKFN